MGPPRHTAVGVTFPPRPGPPLPLLSLARPSCYSPHSCRTRLLISCAAGAPCTPHPCHLPPALPATPSPSLPQARSCLPLRNRLQSLTTPSTSSTWCRASCRRARPTQCTTTATWVSQRGGRAQLPRPLPLCQLLSPPCHPLGDCKGFEGGSLGWARPEVLTSRVLTSQDTPWPWVNSAGITPKVSVSPDWAKGGGKGGKTRARRQSPTASLLSADFVAGVPKGNFTYGYVSPDLPPAPGLRLGPHSGIWEVWADPGSSSGTCCGGDIVFFLCSLFPVSPLGALSSL